MANPGQLRAGQVEHVPPAIQATANRLGHQPQVLDGCQQLDQALEFLAEARAVAVHVAGTGESLSHFQQLLDGEHGADAGPASQKADIVQPAKGRRLARGQCFRHFGYQGLLPTDLLQIRPGFRLAGQLLAQRASRIGGQQLADLAEFQQLQCVRIHHFPVKHISETTGSKAWFGGSINRHRF